MLILKKQQRFKSERYFKINLSSNDNKKNAIINSAETEIWNEQRYYMEERKN